MMTKAAIASLTQCLGRDHAHQNIRVNAVCPNEVDTPMLRSGFPARGLDPKAIDDLNASVPLGRIAEPQDITDVITFLAPDAARCACGSLVEVNGGKLRHDGFSGQNCIGDRCFQWDGAENARLSDGGARVLEPNAACRILKI